MDDSSNTDLFYLYMAQKIDDFFNSGHLGEAYDACREALQDPWLPFYYRGQYHLMLSRGLQENAALHARKALDAFENMAWQSPHDPEMKQYVAQAQSLLESLTESGMDDAESVPGTTSVQTGSSTPDGAAPETREVVEICRGGDNANTISVEEGVACLNDGSEDVGDILRTFKIGESKYGESKSGLELLNASGEGGNSKNDEPPICQILEWEINSPVKLNTESIADVESGFFGKAILF